MLKRRALTKTDVSKQNIAMLKIEIDDRIHVEKQGPLTAAKREENEKTKTTIQTDDTLEFEPIFDRDKHSD